MYANMLRSKFANILRDADAGNITISIKYSVYNLFTLLF